MLAPTPYFADRGCHVRIYEEARALIRLGNEVRIVTYHIGRDMPGIPTSRIPAVPWYRKLAAGPSWHKPYLDLLLLARAIREIRCFRPDLIHAHLHEGAFVGIFLKRLFRLPLVFDCQGSLTAEMLDHGFMRRGGVVHRVFRRIERFINRHADRIVTSSGPAAADLRDNWGIDPLRVTPLMDGVDTEKFAPRSKAEARRALNLPADCPIAVFLGVLNRYQGVDLLFDAIQLLRQRGKRLHFLIMGFPEEPYRKLAAVKGIADCMTFTGRIDYAEVPRLLAAGDVALSPKISTTEANGKLLNYMACGLPSVVFDTPVNRELLGEDGVYARFGDAGDFGENLAALVSDEARLQGLAGSVRERAIREHSWQARAVVLLRLYRDLLSEGTGSA